MLTGALTMETTWQANEDDGARAASGAGPTQSSFLGKQFALYKSLRLLGYYESPGEAFAAGIAQFPDGTFSIQDVARGQQPPELRSSS